MKYSYIAIEREYGSGGTKIARRLAEECGIRCYGEEILEAVAKEYGLTVEQIRHSEETITNSLLYTVYAIAQMQSGSAAVETREGKLFLAEQNFIRQSAAEGAAVYLGHCAGEALQGFRVLKVFIRCSDVAEKERRITEDYGIPKEEIKNTAKRFDSKRAKYYFANTAKKWEDLRNYDLVLDSGTLGIEGCVSALKGLVKS